MFVVLYTLIQIIIESLPISSSTHARLICGEASVTAAYDYFLHGFTVLVIIFYFFKESIFLVRSIHWSIYFRIFFTAVIADSVTAIFYFALPCTLLLQLPILIGLIITACALLSTRYAPVHLRVLSWQMRALIIGFVQGVALLPGISRMGTTYAAARWMGMRPYRAMALSLLVQLPLIGAGFLKGLITLYKTGELMQYITISWALVYIAAMLLAYCALHLTMQLARRHKMWVFGFYVLCLIVVVFFLRTI